MFANLDRLRAERDKLQLRLMELQEKVNTAEEKVREAEASQILAEINSAVLILWKIIHVERCDLEHLIRTFTVSSCDQRSMYIKISSVLEVCVNCHCCNASDAEYSAKEVCTRAKMSHSTKIFSCMALWLNRIVLRTVAEKFNCCCLNFKRLLIFRCK